MKMTFVGKMSTFGGPGDSGMASNEGLALVNSQSDFELLRDYFLAEQPPGTSGWGRRLNPETNYIACRWVYSQTPRSYLLGTLVQVTNPSNGKTELAKPIDWGPNQNTGRVADLSPGLARTLGLSTNDQCQVEITLPQTASSGTSSTGAGGEGMGAQPEVDAGQPPTVLTDSQVAQRFGSFDWKSNGGTAITILGDWVERNIVTVYVPQLDGVPTYGAQFSGRVRWHKDGVEQLQHAWRQIEAAGLLSDVLFWDGSFVPRRKAGGNTLSHHSWGIALDINADWNPFGDAPASSGARGSVRRLVPIFEAHGFAWGGRWRKPDGMHFELAQARSYAPTPWQPDAHLQIEGFAEPLNVILQDGISYASLDALAQATGDQGVELDRNVPAAAYLRARGYVVTWDDASQLILAKKLAP